MLLMDEVVEGGRRKPGADDDENARVDPGCMTSLSGEPVAVHARPAKEARLVLSHTRDDAVLSSVGRKTADLRPTHITTLFGPLNCSSILLDWHYP
jgi:hypothetical protein